MERVERHHACWEKRAWVETPLQKQVRQLGAFILDVHQPNHRLLHARMRPPNIPDHGTLLEMRGLAVGGLELVMQKLDHPIVEHFEEQLRIITLDSDVAWRMIDSGTYHLPI